MNCFKSAFAGTLTVNILLIFALYSQAFGFSDKQGPFIWQPELSPTGPVVIIVSLADQRLSVYRGGKRIGMSPVSTGKPGHRTPTGVFTILQKDVHHHSSKYHNASMPYTQRLTWSGVALHAGGLPGYPESHGCIHVSLKFSKLLFGITHIGTAVIVADEHSAPAEITHPGPLLSRLAEMQVQETIGKIRKKELHHPRVSVWKAHVTKSTSQVPKHVTSRHVSIIVSGADRSIRVLNGDQVLFSAPVKILKPQLPLGSHHYSLIGINRSGKRLRWSGVQYSGGQVAQEQRPNRVISRVKFSNDIAKKILALVHPGTSLIVTDEKITKSLTTKNGFAIITQRDN